jgi:hypothetical protein
MFDWRLWLYPDLRKLPDRDRDRIWRVAIGGSFLPAEQTLIVAGVAAAAVLVKYARFRSVFGNPLLGFAADFIVAALVLVVVAGPAYWLRTRRGLDSAMNKKNL